VTARQPLPVPAHLQRGAHRSRDEWLESGLFAVDVLRRTLGREDLSDVEVLDVGCGTKIVKTLLDHEMPIGRYVGIDAASEVIDWLEANVSDPRFEFHHLDAHNAMYNPTGRALASFEFLPVEADRFELICLFSVFTHLAPHDFEAMLRLLRRHARPDGTLLFSLFLDDPGRLAQAIRDNMNSDDPELRRQTAAAVDRATRERGVVRHPRFVDVDPQHPLRVARYRRDYALELVAASGWNVTALHAPERFIQHYMVCRPSREQQS
jgi:SAM-dependent methyltransferase